MAEADDGVVRSDRRRDRHGAVRGYDRRLAPYHLTYSVRLHDGLLITALYVIAVCGPLLLSGYRHVAVFGIVNLAAVIIIARLTASGFASVWCGWAALSSGAIALHCRYARPHRHHAQPGADRLIPHG